MHLSPDETIFWQHGFARLNLTIVTTWGLMAFLGIGMGLLASQLRKQLQDLKKFSSEKAGSKELENALSQALKSLDALAKKSSEGQEGSESDELSEEATEALRESLKLSKAELQQLARSAKDMKKLEEALRTLQQAEKLMPKQLKNNKKLSL